MKSLEPKIAFVHDWLVTFGGGVTSAGVAARALARGASLYTGARSGWSLQRSHPWAEIYTSFIQRLPGAKRNHRRYLPLMPLAIEQLDLSDYDLVISSSHAVAKGVLTYAGQLHISYLHTPIRYAWDLQDQYLRQSGLDRGLRGASSTAAASLYPCLGSEQRNRCGPFHHQFRFHRSGVEKLYRRQAEVIYPPVDVDIFQPCLEKEDFYLTVALPGAVQEDRPDRRSIQAHARAAVGGDRRRSREAQAGEVGWSKCDFPGVPAPSERGREHAKRPGVQFGSLEDFGIVPLEAQACGTPVIAFGKGGALESVVDGKTGIFFGEQTPESLIQAVEIFEQTEL